MDKRLLWELNEKTLEGLIPKLVFQQTVQVAFVVDGQICSVTNGLKYVSVDDDYCVLSLIREDSKVKKMIDWKMILLACQLWLVRV